MAVNTSLKSTSASMKLQIGDGLTRSVSIPGLVKDVNMQAVFAIAKAINACQVHTMQEMHVTQTTVLSEA